MSRRAQDRCWLYSSLLIKLTLVQQSERSGYSRWYDCYHWVFAWLFRKTHLSATYKCSPTTVIKGRNHSTTNFIDHKISQSQTLLQTQQRISSVAEYLEFKHLYNSNKQPLNSTAFSSFRHVWAQLERNWYARKQVHGWNYVYQDTLEANQTCQ